MITKEEKKAALKAIGFNFSKALYLFSFCWASFTFGLMVLYWSFDYSYGSVIEQKQEHLLKDLSKLQDHLSSNSVSSLYEGVVLFKGKMDFDNVQIIELKAYEHSKDVSFTKVKGQKRNIAPGIFQVRFIKVDDKT